MPLYTTGIKTFTTGVDQGWGTQKPPNPPAISGSYDKNYVQAFTVASQVIVTHNLQKFPAVTVVSSNKQIVIGDVTYTDMNNLTVTFSAPFSGTVYCN